MERARRRLLSRPGAGAPTVEGQQFEPLPAPLPAGECRQRQRHGQHRTSGDRPAPASSKRRRPAPPPPVAPAAPPPPRSRWHRGNDPVPIQSPAPRYPPRCLAHGESGTVLLRVHVGADGVPMAIDLVQQQPLALARPRRDSMPCGAGVSGPRSAMASRSAAWCRCRFRSTRIAESPSPPRDRRCTRLAWSFPPGVLPCPIP